MKYLQSILYVFVLNTLLLAQTPVTLWTKVFGGSDYDWGSCVQQTSDGGYIIVGYTSSISTGGDGLDVLLIKTDANGDALWTKTLDKSFLDRAYSILQTPDGGYIITGGSFDVLLVKTDADGDTLWTRTFDGEAEDRGFSVDITADSGYVVVGCKNCPHPFGESLGEVWLIRTDANGDTLWTKTYGGNDSDLGSSVQQTTDNGYIITGHTRSFGAGSTDVWLIKTDANGDTLWTKTFGGNDWDYGSSVQQTTDGGYIIIGSTGSFGAGSDDVWLIRTDANGDTLWTKTFGGIESEKGWSIDATSDGGYILSGAGPDDRWLTKTDANGNILWNKTFEGANWTIWNICNTVQQTSDGDYIVLGNIESSNNHDDYDIWLTKVASDITSIDKEPSTPIKNYRLQQNYPNPFNPRTTISYSIPQSGFVELKIYNMLGREIQTLVNEFRQSGSYSFDFDASQLSNGVYFYQLKVGNRFSETKKMLYIK